MVKIIIPIFMCLTLSGYAMGVSHGVGMANAATGVSEKAEKTSAGKLLKRLKVLQERGIMVGHHDDPVYGTTWKWEEGKSDVLLTAGDYPAVMSFDLGKLELDSKADLDGVPFDRIRREIMAHYQRGGIITLSWHVGNPVTGANAWDVSGDAVKAVLAGGVQEEKFRGWLSKVSDFIKSLKTSRGRKIPVIFRPWHEMNGGWFWWGSDSCTPEQYKSLYIRTYETLTQAGCDNIVWAWSPNLGAITSADAFLECYPGSRYVDLVGVDVYEFDGNDALYQKNLKGMFDLLEEVGRREGKPIALTETGCRGIAKKTDWFTQTLWPVIRDYPLSYVLFWRNAWDQPEREAYLPGVGDGRIVDDFKAFCNIPRILTAKEVKRIGK